MPITDETRELIRLAELDYERTAKFIQSQVGISTTLRGWAITVWLALVGIGFQGHLPILCIVAAFGALMFAVIDLYHAALYSDGFKRAVDLEDISRRYFQFLYLGDSDPTGESDVQRRLSEHHFGLFLSLSRVRWKDILPWNKSMRARWFLFVYLALIIVGLACAALVAIGPPAAAKAPSLGTSPYPFPVPSDSPFPFPVPSASPFPFPSASVKS